MWRVCAGPIASILLTVACTTGNPQPDAGPSAGAGQVVGSVKLRGRLPQVAAAEAATSGLAWQVSPDGGVANCVVILAPATGAPATRARAPETETLSHGPGGYRPRIVVVPEGGTVRLHNEGSGVACFRGLTRRNESFDLRLPPGAEHRVTFHHDEVVAVEDRERPGTRALIVVVDAAHHTVSGPDGSFAFGDVPPGSYRVGLWHEGRGWVRDLGGEIEVLAGRRLELSYHLRSPSTR